MDFKKFFGSEEWKKAIRQGHDEMDAELRRVIAEVDANGTLDEKGEIYTQAVFWYAGTIKDRDQALGLARRVLTWPEMPEYKNLVLMADHLIAYANETELAAEFLVHAQRQFGDNVDPRTWAWYDARMHATLLYLSVQKDPTSENTDCFLKDLWASTGRPYLNHQNLVSALRILSVHPSTSADPYKLLYVRSLLGHLLDNLLFTEFKKMKESFKIEGNPYIDELEKIIAVTPWPTLEEFKAHMALNNSAKNETGSSDS